MHVKCKGLDLCTKNKKKHVFRVIPWTRTFLFSALPDFAAFSLWFSAATAPTAHCDCALCFLFWFVALFDLKTVHSYCAYSTR